MNIKGKVVQILDEQKGTSAKGEWIKRGFVIETEGQYPKKVAIDVFKGEVVIPNIGTVADVSLNIESREYNGKWYSNITAWKIETGVSAAPPMPDSNTSIPEPSELESDDLPFS